jgi:hypothetical protein
MTAHRRWWVGAAVLVAVAGVAVTAFMVATRGADEPGKTVAPVTTLRPVDHPEAGATRAPAACRGTNLKPGDNVRAALRAAPPGRTFCFAKGTYRLPGPINPKDGQKLIAAPGAVLNGARVLGGWKRIQGRWVSEGAGLPDEPQPHGDCTTGTACQYAEDVFVNNRLLKRVMNKTELKPGTVWEDYAADQVWLADNPASHRVEVALATAAVLGESRNVHVKGFIVEKFANSAQTGTIEGRSPGWNIVANEVRLNHGVGLGTIGGKMLRNHTHHNGQMGMGGQGRNQVVADNEIDHNNTLDFDLGWEAGGGKWVETTGLRLENNYVHDNDGIGLWTDINNVDTTYKGNVIRDNADSGIHHEISFDAVIIDNELSGNGLKEPEVGWGAAGIRIAASPRVEISGNRLIGNANGIMLVQQERTDSPSRLGPHEIRDIQVFDNDVTMGRGVTGMVEDIGDESIFTRNNVFKDNTYRLASSINEPFVWDGALVSKDAWIKRYGQDVKGTFLSG